MTITAWEDYFVKQICNRSFCKSINAQWGNDRKEIIQVYLVFTLHTKKYSALAYINKVDAIFESRLNILEFLGKSHSIATNNLHY